MALTDNIIEYRKFDEASWNIAWSVGSHAGTNTWAIPFAAWKINNWAELPWTASHQFAIANSNDFNLSARTTSFWIKTSTDARYIMSYMADNAEEDLIIWIWVAGWTAHKLNVYMKDKWATAYNSSSSVDDWNWHHIAVTCNATTLTCYVNWSAANWFTQSQAWWIDTNRVLYLWNRYYSGWVYLSLNWLLDECWWWSRVLTSTEIIQLYNAGRWLAYPLTVDLTTSINAYYKLDESSWAVIDSVGSFNGTNSWCDVNQTGKIGTSYLFGSSDYIAESITSTTKNYTVAFWANPWDMATGSDDHCIIDWQTWRLLIYWLINSSWYMWYYDWSVRDFWVAMTAWWRHHYVVVFDDSTDKWYLYIDWSKQATEPAYTARDLGWTSSIWTNYVHAAGSWYIWYLDELWVRERCLTQTEITALYNSWNWLTYPFTAPVTTVTWASFLYNFI